MKEVPMSDPEYHSLSQSLGKFEFFSGLSVAEEDKIFSYIKMYSYEKGETIFKQGDPGDALFIVYQGLLAVKKREFFFGSKTVAELKAGDIFGEMALLDRKNRTAAVVTKTPSQIFVLLTSDFDRVVSDNPNFLREMKSMADRRKFINRSMS